MSNLRQKTIFDQFNLPDLSGGTLSSGLGDMGMGTTFQTPYQSPTYEDNGSMRSSDLQTDFRTPEDIRGIGASNISKVSDVSTKPLEYGQISLPETMDAINKVFTPATRDYDRLGNLLDNAPDINDYNPSFMRKLTAGLQGMKDPTVGQRTLNQPYLQDMGQWTAKTAPFQAAATSENARNTNERTLAGNIVTSITAQNRNAANQQIADQKAKIAQEKIEKDYEVRSRLATVKEFIAKNPDWEIQNGGPTYQLFNPQTKELKDTGVPTGNATDLELANVRGKWGVEQARAGGAGFVVVDGKLGQIVQGPNGPTFIPVQGADSAKTGPSGISRLGTSGTDTKTNTLEDNRARQRRIDDIVERNGNIPGIMQHLRKGASGSYELKPRPVLGSGKLLGYFGEGTSAEDIDKWDLIKREIDPDYSIPPTVGAQTREQNPPAPKAGVSGGFSGPPSSGQLNVREAPIPPSAQNQGIPQSAAPPSQIQTPPVDRKADLVRMLQNPNAEPRLKQAWQAELAQLQTNERNQQGSAVRDTTRANEIAQLLQNPNLGPRERQILMDQARGLPSPGQVPPAPTQAAPQGPSVGELQQQRQQIQAQMQNPGNSSWINQSLQQKLQAVEAQMGQAMQASQQGLGPTTPPTPPQQQQQGQPTNQQTDAQNPMLKRRSFDGGNTWQTSQDGGRTWR